MRGWEGGIVWGWGWEDDRMGRDIGGDWFMGEGLVGRGMKGSGGA